MDKILKQMSENGKEKVKMRGFMKRQEGFEAGKRMRGGRGRILENRYSFFVLDAYFGGGSEP